MESEQFVGMTKRDAQNYAENRNLIFRLIRVDDKNFFPYPEDNREDRICVEIDSGRISKAVIQ
jgi:hypothetical protein